MPGDYTVNMRKYDADDNSSVKSASQCKCSVASGFLMILIAILIAVGVGLIVHFAGNKNVVCKCDTSGITPASGTSGCVALAKDNNAEICKFSF